MISATTNMDHPIAKRAADVCAHRRSGERLRWFLVAWLLIAGLGPVQATETENLNIRMLPAPGKVVIDGKTDDWDLSGGVFICGDVENLRDRFGVWVHAMYDVDNLYVLARWLDETPLSNPGLAGADSPWSGDSLQLRIIADPERLAETKKPAVCWVSGWRDREGTEAIGIDFPNQGGEVLKDAIARGARQACVKNADGKGYVQEMVLPWKLLVAGGIKPEPGKRMVFSVEANFNTTSGFRMTFKDIFRPGVVPDRVFTFTADKCWGYGSFAAEGKVAPQKLRLADNREFAVAMRDGVPVVDWAGLFIEKKVEGFAPIAIEMPEDGFVSLNIRNAGGRVVRQLLNANFLTRGKHEMLWDGLSNLSHLRPGEVVEAGAYTWEAIYHTGIGLRLVGWADNAGKTPFDSPGGNWGGDFGVPCTVASDGQAVYLGWSGSEAGRALVCADLDGRVKWRHRRGGFGQARHVAVANGIVYVNDNQLNDPVLYRLDAQKGQYSNWQGKDSAVLTIGPGLMGLAAANGKLYLSRSNDVQMLDAATGAERVRITVDRPGDIAASKTGSVYVLSSGTRLLRIEEDGSTKSTIDGLQNAQALAICPDGAFCVGIGAPDNQIKVFDAAGKPLRTIGKPGGRPLVGLWEQGGMRSIKALRVDDRGILWVAEGDSVPKRFSCWQTADGSFVREFFGPTGYGAQGGAILPDDPLTMVGSGCEWRLDEKTGRATCVGVFTREAMNSSRLGHSPDGRLYVAISESFLQSAPVLIYERLAPGQYRLRTRLSELIEKRDNGRGKMIEVRTGLRVWSDANGDQEEQPAEVREYKLDLGGWIAGWYLAMTSDMTFYGTLYQLAATGWTACGAPLYDATKARKLPAPADVARRGGMGAQRGCGSPDGKLMLYNGVYGVDHSDLPCYEIETGKLLWTYPNNYVGVHGGHKAPPPQAGMIRGAYDIVGAGALPDPIGDIFVIATDKGEWHILTGQGYYLTKLFEADPLKIRWPDQARPGAIMDSVPPGMGAEDFGGSISITKDGRLYIQAGKTAYINMQVAGLESVRKLPGGKLDVTQADLAKANGFREKLLQASVPLRTTTAKRQTVVFTGELRKDFDARERLAFQKTSADRVETSIAYDDTHLYLGWQVNDDTPWVNGASDPVQMYASGDTVDFQLGADPKADPKRAKPVLGDLRLSIGNAGGKPTAVLYRPVATEKMPRKFFSGTVKEGYEMQSVKVLAGARIDVKVDAKARRYVVEAAIPLVELGLEPSAGMTVGGDFGVTFGDPDGKDTVLRSYWSNQATGLVADEVWELVLEPKNWGRISFE